MSKPKYTADLYYLKEGRHVIVYETKTKHSTEILCEKNSPHLSSVRQKFNHPFDDEDDQLLYWSQIIESMKINFLEFDKIRDHGRFCALASHEAMEKWRTLLNKIDCAVLDYADLAEEANHIKEISAESTKVLLYLVPFLSKHKPNVSIDADTGCFMVTFTSRSSGLMTVLVTGKGELHYSLAERGWRLVKISGTAKIKDPRDLSKFSKVLSML